MAAPLLGISFSHRHAAWLGLNPQEALEALLRDTGIKHVRLSLYWDEIAPAPDRLDFTPLRPWLEIAARYGCAVLMTAGIKAQRHPEFYPPPWLTHNHPMPHGAELEQYPRVVTLLLLMLERAIAFLADYDVIDAWQVENEPFLPAAGRTAGWRISPDLLAREVAVVCDADPRHRPVVINHSSRTVFDRGWLRALQAGDVLAQNVYTRRPMRPGLPLRYRNDYALWPVAPRLAAQAAVARRLGKSLWITELQAEPWERFDLLTTPPGLTGSISPQQLRENLRLAAAARAERIYLWGAEWWLWMARRHNDGRYLALAQSIIAGNAAL